MARKPMNTSDSEIHKQISHHASELKKAKSPAMKKHHADSLKKLSDMVSQEGSGSMPMARTPRKPRATKAPAANSKAAGSMQDMEM